MEETTNTNPSGKGKGIIGFILALVSLILGGWIIAALYAASFSIGVAAIGLLIPILGLVFSVMGMKASKAAGEKRGLAIAGLIIAIVGLIYCGITVAGVAALDSFGGAALDAAQDAMDNYGH
ncbi:MAG: hypothetical protein HOK65_03105 [Crocinitomicaceae bacterium]|jgi:hypothetical protein|nr:hypothetical protein [Crocinitomicaceae bacterium]